MVVWFKDFLRVSRNCWVKKPTFSGTTEAPEFLPSLFPTWRPQWWACLHRWAPDPSHHRYWSWRKQAYGLDPAPAGQTDARRKKGQTSLCVLNGIHSSHFTTTWFVSVMPSSELNPWFILITHSRPRIIHWHSGRRHLFSWLDNSFGNKVIINRSAQTKQTKNTHTEDSEMSSEITLK